MGCIKEPRGKVKWLRWVIKEKNALCCPRFLQSVISRSLSDICVLLHSSPGSVKGAEERRQSGKHWTEVQLGVKLDASSQGTAAKGSGAEDEECANLHMYECTREEGDLFHESPMDKK